MKFLFVLFTMSLMLSLMVNNAFGSNTSTMTIKIVVRENISFPDKDLNTQLDQSEKSSLPMKSRKITTSREKGANGTCMTIYTLADQD